MSGFWANGFWAEGFWADGFWGVDQPPDPSSATGGGGWHFTPETIRKSRQAKDEMEVVIILSALARVGYLQ